MAVSKRLRYEVLRRDNHTCRYCGAAAPEATLTVDHVLPVALGGTDDPGNLVTACQPCNSGKGASNPDQPLVEDVTADQLRWSAAMRAAAETLLADHDRRAELHCQFVNAWRDWTYGSDHQTIPLPPGWEGSIDSILAAGLPIEILCECVNLTMTQKYVKNEFSYMCGIAWRKVAELREIAGSLLEAELAPRGKHHRQDES